MNVPLPNRYNIYIYNGRSTARTSSAMLRKPQIRRQCSSIALHHLLHTLRRSWGEAPRGIIIIDHHVGPFDGHYMK